MGNLFDRLDFLRKDRAYHTWLGGLGVARDTVKNIKDRSASPTETVLTTIAKCEGASFLWLTEGTGTPYSVARFDSDEECYATLQDHLIIEPWTAYVISSKSKWLIVLTLPNVIERPRSGFINYIAIEILTNPGKKSISEAAMHAGAFKRIELDQTIFKQIENGQIGTYELLGTEKKAGLLTDAKLIGMTDRLSDYAFTGGTWPQVEDSYHESTEQFDITTSEQNLIGLYRDLSDENKEFLAEMAKKLIDKNS